jgi:ankyrin repeat protein
VSLSIEEIQELNKAFADLLNYDSDDPTDLIEPITYRAPDGDTCLHIAAVRNDLRAAELLLKAGVDVNSQGDMGYTPLHHAVRKKQTAMVELLMSHGASMEIRNEFGKLPSDM